MNLPTDYWVPSTARITPMKARQYAVGVYTQLPYNIRWSVEGFYKTMDNLIEYDGNSGMLNPMADRWEEEVRTGKGKAYGMETDIRYSNGKTSVPIHFRGARDFSLTSILHGIRISLTTGIGFLSISGISLMKELTYTPHGIIIVGIA